MRVLFTDEPGGSDSAGLCWWWTLDTLKNQRMVELIEGVFFTDEQSRSDSAGDAGGRHLTL